MKRIFTTFSIFLFLVAYALGQQSQVIVNYYDSPKGAINVPQDKVLVIQLPVKHSNGYEWQVVDMNKNVLVEDPQIHYVPINKGIGSEGYSELRFEAKTGGTSTLILCYRRPWEKKKSLEQVTYTINTEGKYTGDIKFEEPNYQAPKLNKEDYSVKSLPSSYSLVTLGYMTPVKDQGNCGSCWAFAGCGVFESVIKKTDGVTRDLSEQWMVNCGGDYGFSGCSGGYIPFDMFNDGVVYEADEPYQATEGTCKNYTKHEKIDSWSEVDGNNPTITEIKQAIYDHGALWCGVDATGMSSYTGGVWQGTGTSNLDHAVVLVGWDDNNQCWIMRNSWGSSWGENGYIRVAYGANGIGSASTYVIYSGSGGYVAPTVTTGSITSIGDNSAVCSGNITDNGGTTVTASGLVYAKTTAPTLSTGTVVSTSPVITSGSYSLTMNGLSSGTTYYVRSYATNSAGTNYGTEKSFTTTGTAPVEYCSSMGNNYSYEWISEVNIGNYDNASNASGYTDFTSETVEMAAGNDYAITLTPGFSSSSYNEYWRIWIDLNADGDFDDAGELVFDAGAASSNVVNGTITIPAGTSAITTRMRVSMKYNGSQTACETFNYGEVEDYTVVISGATPDTEAPSVPTGLTSSNITTNSVTISWNASTDNVGVAGYELYKDGSKVATVTSTSYNVTGLSASTSYSFAVKAKDAAGNTSALSNSISVTTSDNQITYCPSKGNSVNYEWIDLVQLNQINNSTGSNGGYADFTSMTANVVQGSSQTIYLSCGFASSSYTEYWHVWIDWDHSGTFDSDERMVYGSSSSSGTLSANFTVPSDAILGTTRMRVTMKYNSAATSCETFSYGEVEDYSINVTNTSVNSLIAGHNADAEILGTEASTEINVYPNPASSYINVNVLNGNKFGIITIYNMIGAVVKTVEIEGNEKEIDISDLPAGSYIISVEDEKEPIIKHFIKK